MDAVKFIEERNRMCKSFCDGCKGCAAFNACEDDLCCAVGQGSTLDATAQVDIVEKWSAAHPRKTRQSVFLEQYPNARIDSQAVIYVCPADAYGDKVCPKNEENFHMLCCDCRHEFWGQEVE